MTQKPLKKAVILAGGFGSRLKDFTQYLPKPLLPVRGKPVMEYSIDLLKRHGISDVALSVHYMADKIKSYYGEGKELGMNFTYLYEDTPLGTAGVLRLYKDWFDGPFVMCNADEIKDIDLTRMYNEHVRNGALITIALTQVEDPSQYGVVELRGSQIARFVEKPPKDQAPSNKISAGLYIIDPSVLSLVPSGMSMIEKDVFPRLAKEGKLYGFEFSGQWFDTGTPERYFIAELLWEEPEKTLVQ